MALIDISAPLGLRTAPFPGDTPFTRKWTMRMSEGDSCNVSAVTQSPHVGTHADAPYHYDPYGLTTEQLPLDLYVGLAQVVHVRSEIQDGQPYVTVDALRAAAWPTSPVERILLRTDSYRDVAHFDPGFAALSPEAVDYLADYGVRLIGVDTPSVDPAASTDLPAHRRCCERGVLILEVLRLAHVIPGMYELIALPLALSGSDASPVRAVLRTLDT